MRADLGDAARRRPAYAAGAVLCLDATAPRNAAEALKAAAAGDPEGERGFVFVSARAESVFLSHAQLLDEASRILGGLRARGAKPGDSLVLQLENARDFIPVTWACLIGGLVAVPVAVAPVFSADNAASRKLSNICAVLGDPLLVADEASAAALAASDLGIARVALAQDLRAGEAAADLPETAPQETAFILFTSGSTGKPKGVVLSHENILAMAAGTTQMNGFSAQDVALNWMPLDHVGAIVFLGVLPVSLGATQIHVPTRLIVEDPLLWLSLIAERRATISWAPNFAFDLVSAAAADLAEGAFDLSSMRFLVNAGEQVAASTARRFLEILERQKLPEDALRPAFGMSETCSGVTWSPGLTRAQLVDERPFLSLGGPIPGAEIRIADESGETLFEGDVGQLELRGASVARGYFDNDEANAQAFAGEGWFRSGDLGFIEHGELHVTGRAKEELVVNGRNIPAHEIEACIEEVEGVALTYACAFSIREAGQATEKLVATFASQKDEDDEALAELMSRIRRALVENTGVAPAQLVPLARDSVPRTGIGKIQRGKLKESYLRGEFDDIIARFARRVDEAAGGEALSGVEEEIAAIWRATLGLERVGREENFFDLGGHSLSLIQMHARIEAAFGPTPLADLFMHTTIAAQARHFAGAGEASLEDLRKAELRRERIARRREGVRETDIAVIGMAGRFPGANDLDAFWRNLVEGVESISFFSEEEVLASGVDPRSARHPDYVKASPVLDDAAGFDAGFFGFSDKEAETMDPQHRLFLECCWEAMEQAGYDPLRYPGSVALYAGASMNTYLVNNVLPHRARFDPQDDLASFSLDSMGGFQLMVANDKDYLNTRVSYKLNLRGPSINVQTACSTGLVVIHQAIQSLLSGECDMALAGTSSVQSPQAIGHLYQEGMIVSPDGHCRAFDAKARGTIFGSGVGAVLLKRLSDAQRDGDHVFAVVKGSAVNNDGLRKVGYMAPSEAGESEVVREALDVAGVDASTIGFVEAHGTGTEIGDPIEVASLTRAFRADTQESGFCALGSVKTNVGHLQISSGIVGFIKAALALHHRTIPATLHYESPNPAIDFEKTPFFVNGKAITWPQGEGPRRAGVNSLGIGGTNAHVILEEAPEPAPRAPEAPRKAHILTLSAREAEPLSRAIDRYRDHVAARPDLPLADLCYTAGVGRHHFATRFACVFATREELLERLAAAEIGPRASAEGGVAFMFTGQGAQYAGMARGLYESRPVFRAALDRCADILADKLDRPLRDLLFEEEGALLDETVYTQPVLFCVEYALAQLWLSIGVEPDVLVGHSVGEYVAACLAEVFSLEDGLALICARARLMHALPRDGAMAAIMAEEEAVAAVLRDLAGPVAIAAVNGERNVVVSGAAEEVEKAVRRFETQGVHSVALKTSHAFHSPLMLPMLDAFRREVEKVSFAAPRLAVVSNLTGRVESALLTDPDYWVRHVVEPVRFAASIEAMRARGCGAYLEIGPKPVLAGMVRAALGGGAGPILASLAPKVEDERQFLDCIAALFEAGSDIDWSALHDGERRRIPLPTYPFAHKRYWLEPPARAQAAQAALAPPPATEPEALHPLVDRRIATPGLPQILFEKRLDAARLPLLYAHRVFGKIVVAGAGHLSMLLGAAGLLAGREGHAVTDVAFPEALVLPEHGARVAQAQFTPQGAAHAIRLVSYDPDNAGDEYQLHLTGTLGPVSAPTSTALDHAAIRARCAEEIAGAQIYARLAAREIALGPEFSWIARLWRGEGEALFEIAPPAGLAVDPAFELHPGLIDSLLQPSLMVLGMGEGDETHVPFALEAFRFHARPAAFPLWGHAVRRGGAGEEAADIAVFDATGACIAEVTGFAFRRVDKALLLRAGGLDGALFATALREIPAGLALAASHAAPLSDLMSRRDLLTQGMAAMLEEVNGPHYRSQSDDLETLGLIYIRDLLRDADVMPAPGETLTTEAIANRLDAAPQFRPLVRRLLLILAQHGRLAASGEEWEGLACPDLPHRAEQIARIRARHGERADAELTLLTRCGEPLPEIVSGRADPLEALFPGGDLSLTTKLYRDSAGFRALNTLVANAVSGLVAQMPEGRRFRVLEIGAGTGATSHYLLSKLDPENSEYCFTDISNLFLARARERFAEYGFVDYRLLDIERDPQEQGFEGQYDLVVAANVLHATRDIGQTLTHARRLLRPGGHVVLLEVNVPTVPVDLTFGLLEGWWRFTDHALRPDYPLLSREQWLAQLRAHGFAEAEVAEIGIPSPGGLQSVFVARADGGERTPARHWTILAGSGEAGRGLSEALARDLRGQGQACEIVEDASELLPTQDLFEGGDLVDLRALDLAPEDDPLASLEAACGGPLDLLPGLLERDAGSRLHLVTRAARTTPAASALQGFARVLRAEHPERAGLVIDLAPGAEPDEAARLLAQALLGSHGETEIAIADGGLHAPRLVPAAPVSGEPFAVDASASYLVTGGLGGIGLHLAKALVSRGARNLVLMGRSMPDEAQAAAVSALAGQGASIRIVRGDICDADAVAGAVAVAREAGPLKGVFHLAGVLRERVLELLTREELREAVAAKILGAHHLDSATREDPLDAFVLFSSVAGLLGLPGQGAYAAANAWLDAFAAARREEGRPVLCVDWGRWSQVGMVAGEAERLAAQGFDAIEPEAGMDLLFSLLAAPPAQAIVLPARFERLVAGRGVVASLLREAAAAPPRPRAASRPEPAPTRTAISAPPALREKPTGEELSAYLAEQVRQVLGSARAPDPALSLVELGLDSLMNIDLRNRIARDVGINLPLGALIDASLAQLALDLLARLAVAGRAPDAASVGEAAAEDEEEEILL